MNTLVIQDSFEPYYAGRPGYTAADAMERRKPARKTRSEAGRGKAEGRRDRIDGPEVRPDPERPEH